jgi:large conductance mechanosensitive channel
MGMFSEFKTFAMKGNVVDLAVGVIIGGAFGKIVAALVEQILMPPIGMLIGGVDFSKLRIVLRHAEGTQPEVVIGYGIFLQAVVNFAIIAWALFLVIKAMNRMHKDTPPPVVAPSEEILLLREIRDSLRK